MPPASCCFWLFLLPRPPIAAAVRTPTPLLRALPSSAAAAPSLSPAPPAPSGLVRWPRCLPCLRRSLAEVPPPLAAFGFSCFPSSSSSCCRYCRSLVEYCRGTAPMRTATGRSPVIVITGAHQLRLALYPEYMKSGFGLLATALFLLLGGVLSNKQHKSDSQVS